MAFTESRPFATAMEARRVDGAIRLGSEARQRFFDARGIGRPSDGGLDLAWIEAAYLLLRGDLETVDGADVEAFLADPPDVGAIARLVTYRDLRDRGYYLSIDYHPVDPPEPGEVALAVRPRGADPTGDQVAHRVRIVTEGTTLPVATLDPGVVAVVDDEAEVTYLRVDDGPPEGEQPTYAGPMARGRLAGDRVLVSDPPRPLHEEAFFGRYLEPARLVLNLTEARYLVDEGHLQLGGEASALLDRGRAVTGAAFDARSRIYGALRRRGLIPRSGLKFGATYRVYDAIDGADDPGHSRLLVDVHGTEAAISVRALSRSVRLATGVRKTHVLAIVGDEVRWRAVDRLTP